MRVMRCVPFELVAVCSVSCTCFGLPYMKVRAVEKELEPVSLYVTVVSES